MVAAVCLKKQRAETSPQETNLEIRRTSDRPMLENEFAPRLRQAGEIRIPLERRAAVREVFAEWCRKDPRAAFAAWLDTGGPTDPADDAWLLREIRGQLGFDGTFNLIREVQAPLVREHFLNTLASQLHETDDPEAGLRCFLNLPPDFIRDEVLPTAVHSWSRVVGFETVVAWIDDPAKNFQAPEMALLERAATLQLLESHPSEAAAWLIDRATEASRPEHLAHIAGTWAQFTPNAAGEWLSSLPPDPRNDLAIAAFSRVITQDDPQSAATWAASIQKPELRAEAVRAAVESWARIDPAAAARFSESQQFEKWLEE